MQKEFWRVHSRLMAERSEFVNSFQRKMCGRGCVVGAATITHPGGAAWEVQAGYRQQGLENGLRALRRQAERKTESPKVWKLKKRSFGPGLKPWRKKEGKEPKEDKAFHPGEKAAWRKSEVWKWTPRMRSRAEKSWMSKGENCRRSCDTLKKLSCIPKEAQGQPQERPPAATARGGAKVAWTSCQNTRKRSKDRKR